MRFYDPRHNGRAGQPIKKRAEWNDTQTLVQGKDILFTWFKEWIAKGDCQRSIVSRMAILVRDMSTDGT